MRDQVEQVHALYRDLAGDPDWLSRYQRDPEAVLNSYSIHPHNRQLLKDTLALYCRAEASHV